MSYPFEDLRGTHAATCDPVVLVFYWTTMGKLEFTDWSRVHQMFRCGENVILRWWRMIAPPSPALKRKHTIWKYFTLTEIPRERQTSTLPPPYWRYIPSYPLPKFLAWLFLFFSRKNIKATVEFKFN